MIADIGSGTGISAKVFLENGNKVFGIEPNGPMRPRRKNFLPAFRSFTAATGTAENTGLPDDSIDIVVAAQAFHWFEPETAKAEFRRILTDDGFLALVWNERELDTTAFLVDYERFLLKYATDYTRVRHDNVTAEKMAEFFGKGLKTESFRNEQDLDLQGLTGRALSSSYMPAEGDAQYEPMGKELGDLFAKHAESGKIKLSYNTKVFYSHL